MKVVLTSIVHTLNKKQCTIFSVDVWPGNSSCVVTGGQDGSIKVWMVSDAKSKEESSLVKHTGAVLCTRFSPDGELLATASDDGNVIVWGVTETNGTIQLHTKKRLSDHKSDVSSVAWSSKYLATGGYDGSVIIYDREKFNILSKLEKHEKGCKGIAFSPGSGYISTYGDEGELFLYDKTFKKISSSKKPFKGVQMESFFGRMSWSPDAKYVACGLAFLEKQDAVVLLSSSLTRSYTLIGHAAPVEAVAFNPWLWEKENSTGYILATGSQDRSVAIWSSSSSKPLILLREISEQPIMDLRWSADGKVLLGCTYDGSVFLLEFEEKELGEPVIPTIEESKTLPYSKEFIAPEERIENLPSPLEEIKNISTVSDEIIFSELKEPEKKKKIVPRFIAPLEAPDQTGAVKGPRVVLFTPHEKIEKNIEPEKCVSIIETESNKNKYVIQIKSTRDELTVRKNNQEWFKTLGHHIKMAAADENILGIISTEHTENEHLDILWVYDLEKGVLLLPAVPFTSVFSIDVRKRKVLIAMHSRFKVFDLETFTCIDDVILSHSSLLNILLDENYFLTALYENGTIQQYNPQMKMWFILEMNSPSVYSDTYTGETERDCTFEGLENQCLIGILHSNWSLVDDSIQKIIESTGRTESLSPGLVNRVDGIIEEVISATPKKREKAKYICDLLVKSAETEEFQKYAYIKIKEIQETHTE